MRGAGQAGSNAPWEISHCFLKIPSRATSPSETPDPYQNRGEVLIAFHRDHTGQLDREPLHIAPRPLSPSARQPCPSVLCRRLFRKRRPENNACPWPESAKVASNLHQQDLPLRLPHSGLLILTPTWKCQGPQEARKCVICPTSPKLVTSICIISSSGHQPRPFC